MQFTAVPWLRDHLRGEIAGLVETVELDPGQARRDARRRRQARRRRSSAATTTRQPARPVRRRPSSRRCSTGSPRVMSLLEGHADVVMDGVGPEVIPIVAEIRSKFNQRRKGAGTARPAAAPAARPRRQDGAVPRRRRASSAASSTRSAWRASTRSGSSRRTCRPRPRSPTRRPGCAACTAEPSRLMRPRPRGRRRSGSPSAGRCARRSAPVDRVLVACSGGADSLALAGRDGLRGAHGRGWPVGGVDRRPRAAGRLGRAAPTRGGRRWPRSASTRRWRSGSTVDAPGSGPEAAAREARYAALDEARRALRRRRRPARAHPRRPGRDRAARAGPRLRRPLARRDAPAARGRYRAAAARADPGADRGGLPGRGPRVLGRPAQRRPALHPGRGCGTRVLPVLEARARARGRRGAGPHRRPAARRTPTPRRAAPSAAARASRTATAGSTSARCSTAPPAAVQPGCCAARPSSAGCPPAELFARARRRARRLVTAGTGRAPTGRQAGPAARARHGVPRRVTHGCRVPATDRRDPALWQADAHGRRQHVEGDLVDVLYHRGADPAPARRAGRARSSATTRARTCCWSVCSRARSW